MKTRALIILMGLALTSCSVPATSSSSEESCECSFEESTQWSPVSTEDLSSDDSSEAPSESSDPSLENSSEEPSIAFSENTSEQTSVEDSTEPSIESTDHSSEETSKDSSVSSDAPLASWNLVTSIDDLNEGDTIVFAASSKSAVAGQFVSTSNSKYLESLKATFSQDKATLTEEEDAMRFVVGKSGSYWTFESSEGKLGAIAAKKLAFNEGTSTWNVSIASNGKASVSSTVSDFGSLQCNGNSARFTTYTSSQVSIQIYTVEKSEPIYPESLEISGSNEVEEGKTTELSVTFAPEDTNRKQVQWTSLNPDVATVSNGVVKGVSSGTASIVAEAKNAEGETISNTFEITVTEAVIDDYTVMIYICGSNLESYDSEYREYGAMASANIYEILQVDLPDNVNVLIETGGANNWDPSYASAFGAQIPAKLTRWTVQNQKLVQEDSALQPKDASMGKPDTFEEFMEWGLNNYPAKHTGVVLWNHGGAMDGCCYDERYYDDALTVSELNTSLSGAFASTGTEKLDWIGYDCCLMAVQDIADLNSQYFDYQVSSQETEPGGGWNYTPFMQAIADNSNIDALSLGSIICDAYYKKCGDTYYSYYQYDPKEYADYKDYNDATLSVLDLTKMEAYRTAFENMADELTGIVNSSTKWKTLKNAINKAEKYGIYEDYSYYNGGYVYDVFNLSTALSEIKKAYSSVDVDSVIAALDELIAYNRNGKNSPNACGLNLFAAISGANYKSIISEKQTRFSSWSSLNLKYGSFDN